MNPTGSVRSADLTSMRKIIEAFDGSTSLQVGAVLDLMTDENVDWLMIAMPTEFSVVFRNWLARMIAGGELMPGASERTVNGYKAARTYFEKERNR